MSQLITPSTFYILYSKSCKIICSALAVKGSMMMMMMIQKETNMINLVINRKKTQWEKRENETNTKPTCIINDFHIFSYWIGKGALNFIQMYKIQQCNFDSPLKKNTQNPMHTHTQYTHTLSLSHTHTQTLTHPHPDTHTPSHTLFLSLSHTHIQTHTHKHTHT